MDVTGTLVWYYMICPREVWMMSRNILPDQKDENIDYGRFLHENTYKRNEKEVSFGNVKFDVIFKSAHKLVIGETKKTSKYEKASKYQLAFYLKVLRDVGVAAEGQLLYPEERRRVDVILTDELERELEIIRERITEIAESETAPRSKKIPFCKNCGYREYCYA